MSITKWGKRKGCAALLFCWPLVTGSAHFRTGFDARILSAHNRERAALGLPSLSWNPNLASGAKRWSEHLARTGQFAHSPDHPGDERLGENIWGGTPDRYSPEAMVTLWIAEKRHFRPGVFPANSATGDVTDVAHYTQLVWRGTRQVGCHLSRGASEEVLVCRYSSPGNVIGQKVL